MVEKLIGALSQNIGEIEESDYRVYTEDVFQNVVMPCIFIECETVEKVQLLGRRFMLRAVVKITINDERDEAELMINKMQEKLFGVMNTVIGQDCIFYGRKIRSVKEQGRRVIRGEYDLFRSEEEEAKDMMESVEMIREEQHGDE